MTSCGLAAGLGLTGHSSLAPYCYRMHVRLRRRQLAATIDPMCDLANGSSDRIATPFAISNNSRMLDLASIITPVAKQAIPEIPSCACRGSINQPIPVKSKIIFLNKQ